MKILWLTWKDLTHPQAGGAELANEEIAKRLVRDGHEVTMLVGGYAGAKPEEIINGYKIVRLGNRYTVYWEAYRYYKRHLSNWADLTVEEINTVPFFSRFYAHGPRVLVVYQLARQIWFYQMPLPFSLVGYLAEPLYIRLLSHQRAITISESSKKDLVRYGFKPDNVGIITLGVQIDPVSDPAQVQKYETPTLLSLGAVRPMKQTADQVKAFEIAKKSIPDLKLKIAGDTGGRYGKKVLALAKKSRYAADIEVLGRVSQDTKRELMQRCHVILVTSVKEGWGLIVTEAGIQSTPAVVYDVDGLRDSVRHGHTGLVSKQNTHESLAASIVELMADKDRYDSIRNNAWEWNRGYSLERSYEDFLGLIS